MRAAASTLPPAHRRADCGPEIAFLSGRNYWHQTLFCAWSLLTVSDCDFSLTVYDDGSLHESAIISLKRVLTGVRIILRPEIEAKVDRFLPARRFPTLRHRRIVYPHLRKLTDIHVAHKGPVAVLDSDMLFLKQPTALSIWLKEPVGGCCMRDCENSYGYPSEGLQSLLDKELMETLNVGVAGLISEEVDWSKLEFWCSALINRYGQSYYLEQALCAMLFSERLTSVLPSADYIVRPTADQVSLKCGVLHHYVAESKYAYRREAWRRITQARPL